MTAVHVRCSLFLVSRFDDGVERSMLAAVAERGASMRMIGIE